MGLMFESSNNKSTSLRVFVEIKRTKVFLDFSKGEIYSILGEGEKGIQSLKNNKISSYYSATSSVSKSG